MIVMGSPLRMFEPRWEQGGAVPPVRKISQSSEFPNIESCFQPPVSWRKMQIVISMILHHCFGVRGFLISIFAFHPSISSETSPRPSHPTFPSLIFHMQLQHHQCWSLQEMCRTSRGWYTTIQKGSDPTWLSGRTNGCSRWVVTRSIGSMNGVRHTQDSRHSWLIAMLLKVALALEVGTLCIGLCSIPGPVRCSKPRIPLIIIRWDSLRPWRRGYSC